LAGIQKRRHPNLRCNANGEIITDIQQKLVTWKNYVKELFDDERHEYNIDSIEGDERPEISKEVSLTASTKQEIPKEWLLSTFVTIPKKANAKQSTDHRPLLRNEGFKSGSEWRKLEPHLLK